MDLGSGYAISAYIAIFRQLSLSPILIALLFAILSTVGVSRPAQSADIVVNSSIDAALPLTDLLCTLREAMTNANLDVALYSDCPAGSGADTISFISGLTGSFIAPATSLPLITGDLVIEGTNRNITVLGTSARPFTITSGTVEFRGLSITGGSQTSGGGIFIGSGSLKLSSCSVTGNNADNGGGIYINDGALSLVDTVVSGNTADTDGGGIYVNAGSVSLTDSTVKGNISGDNGGGISCTHIQEDLSLTNTLISGNRADFRGGGIYYCDLKVVDSTISDNIAMFGGGMADTLGTIERSVIRDNTTIENDIGRWGYGGGVYTDSWMAISDSTFIGNRAEGRGGAYHLNAEGGLILRNSTFSGNFADEGGGAIWNEATHVFGGTAYLTIYNSTISSNTSNTDGGGIYSVEPAKIINSTIAANDAINEGGGIYALATIFVDNSIIAQNSAGTYDDCRAFVNVNSPNLIGSITGCSIVGETPITGNPGLGTLASNGGFTKTHALLAGSSAIDAGDNAICNDPALAQERDQRNVPRPQGNFCDLGAFEKEVPLFSVTPSIGSAQGTISPSTKQDLFSGQTTSFTLTPAANHHIESVGGTCGGSLDGATYTTNPVSADCTVVANFAIDTFTVRPSAGAGGGISPSTDQEIDYDATPQFLLTPDPGFHIESVGGTCGGSLDEATYTTNPVRSDCTVVASFAIDTFTVSPSTGAGGDISPSIDQEVDYNSTPQFLLTPNPGFHIESVGGTCGGSLDETTYTTNPVSEDCTVQANFAIDTFTVSPSAGAGGGISPSIDQEVDYDTTPQFLLTPDPGFHIESVDGTCGGYLDNSTYTTNPVSADCTVVANFAIDTFTVSPSTGAGGGISPSTDQEIEGDTTTQFSLRPDPGFHIESVGGTCGGSLDDTTYTTNPVSADCTVVANFEIDRFTVSSSAGIGGDISPSIDQEVDYNSTPQFLLTPDPGFRIESVGGTCGGSLDEATYTTNPVREDCSVLAIFVKQPDDIFSNGFEN